ncbi:MAG: hypothetical protein L0I24_14565 [Pseudonocardia sp.]|nr:hypothetical protein [Pseudonocardia sp.]
MSDVLVDLGAVPDTAVASAVVALGGVEPPPGQPEFGKSSPVALVVILVLGLATVLLIVSMTRHLRKVPASFDTEEPPPAEDAPEPRP